MSEDTKVRYINTMARCFQCGKQVTKVLALEKTRAPLCSLGCESKYWLDIFH